jgi:drug/metabolite transporter (DMT)-like permease
VTAVIAGLSVALIWTVSTLASARAARAIGAPSTLAAVALVGMVATLPLLATAPAGPSDATDHVPWLLLAGGGNILGLLLSYTALTRGKVSIVAPIASTEGAIAATISILLGEPITGVLLVALSLVVTGVVLTAWGPEGDETTGTRGGPVFLALAVGSALLFGVSLYAVGHSSLLVPAAWVVAAGRIIGVVFLTLPLLLTRRFRMTRAVLPLVVLCGCTEVVGFLLIAWGSQESIAVTSVLSSQFAVLTALASVALGERVLRHQLLGALITGIGVAAVTLAHA